MVNSKIRVALVITELEPGGAEKAMTTLARGLDRTRFEPVVCSLRGREYHRNPVFIEQLEASAVPVEFVGIRGVAGVPGGIRKLRKILQARSFDVVQSFMFHANFIARLAARAAAVPVVCSGIRVAERHASWHLWLDRMTSARVDRYVCVSESTAEFTRRTGHIPGEKVVVITNGIEYPPETTVEGTSAFPFDSRKKHIGFVGRMAPQKGIDWLLDTAETWLAPRKDWDLILFGDGPERKRYEETAQAGSCADRIVFAGQRSDIPAILPHLNLLVLPSRWEGMPNAVMEAMAAGLPVLCTRVEGTAELLGPLAERQSTPFGDSDRWASAVGTLLDDPELRQALGQANRARIAESYVMADKIREYERLWTALLDAAKRA